MESNKTNRYLSNPFTFGHKPGLSVRYARTGYPNISPEQFSSAKFVRQMLCCKVKVSLVTSYLQLG